MGDRMCKKKVKDQFWDLGLSYEAPFITIGSQLWVNTSKRTQKSLDNYNIDTTGECTGFLGSANLAYMSIEITVCLASR